MFLQSEVVAFETGKVIMHCPCGSNRRIFDAPFLLRGLKPAFDNVALPPSRHDHLDTFDMSEYINDSTESRVKLVEHQLVGPFFDNVKSLSISRCRRRSCLNYHIYYENACSLIVDECGKPLPSEPDVPSFPN